MKSDGCVICSGDLIYLDNAEEMTCVVCKKSFSSNAKCVDGHFICDSCHELEGFEYIMAVCSNTSATNPAELAVSIMNSPKIKLHGPEHHFLVPAVLLTSYYNKIGQPEMIREKLEKAAERAKNILGGFCGFYGSCGAGVGTGIFMSLILNSTPLSKNEWKLSNLMTARSLYSIAANGGPRCCKRDTYLSIESSIAFLEENMAVKLDSSVIACGFSSRNKQCLHAECRYFTADQQVSQAITHGA